MITPDVQKSQFDVIKKVLCQMPIPFCFNATRTLFVHNENLFNIDKNRGQGVLATEIIYLNSTKKSDFLALG